MNLDELRERAESGNRIFRSATVLQLLDELERERTRAEKAELECATWRDLAKQNKTAYDVQRARAEKAEAENKRLREAMMEITRREGAYSRDPWTHAENTIDNMVEIAQRALKGGE